MIIRLQKSEPSHLSWYEDFESRIRSFVQKYEPEAGSCLVDAILQEMISRWIQNPPACGYFLALDDTTTPIGHVASWINPYYGSNRLYIWQAEMDVPMNLLMPFILMVRSWIQDLNVQLPESSKVRKFEYLTWHSDDVWERYLKKAEISIISSHSLITGIL